MVLGVELKASNLARQILYYLRHTPSPPFFSLALVIFEMGSYFMLGLAWTIFFLFTLPM
jgi:hypothetical protein